MKTDHKRSAALTANIEAILDRVAATGEISRVELASYLGMTKSSVSDSVRYLESLGILGTVATLEGDRGVGRPRQALTMADTAGVVAGLQAEGDYFVGVLSNFRGETIHRRVGPLPPGTQTEHRLAEAVRELLSTSPVPVSLRGVALGLPGIMDFQTGTVRFSYSFGIKTDTRLAPALSLELGVPVAIENDANCCAYGALRDPRVRPTESFLYVLVDFLDEKRFTPLDRAAIGIGISFVFRGELWRGDGSSAGEFRSFRRIDSDSRQLHLPQGMEREMRSNAEVRERVIQDIAENVAYLSTMCDLGDVVIAGDICAYHDAFGDWLKHFQDRLWMYPLARNVAITSDDHHEYSVAEGASVLIRDLLLARTTPPNYRIERLVDQMARIGAEQ